MPILSPDVLVSAILERIENACARSNRSPAEITLIGASKTVDAARLGEFLSQSLHHFGENYIQEGLSKIRCFDSNGLKANWHFIGALQSNKAREAVGHFELIHGVDRISLAKELDKEAKKIGKIQKILIQVNVAGESSKAGVASEGLEALLEQVRGLENLRFEGLMSLPPYQENPELSRPYHQKLKQLGDSVAGSQNEKLLLSMGMSNDFEVAIEEGATHIRVGTALFGVRS